MALEGSEHLCKSDDLHSMGESMESTTYKLGHCNQTEETEVMCWEGRRYKSSDYTDDASNL